MTVWLAIALGGGCFFAWKWIDVWVDLQLERELRADADRKLTLLVGAIERGDLIEVERGEAPGDVTVKTTAQRPAVLH